MWRNRLKTRMSSYHKCDKKDVISQMELESDLLLCKNWIEAKSKDWSDTFLLLSRNNTKIQISVCSCCTQLHMHKCIYANRYSYMHICKNIQIQISVCSWIQSRMYVNRYSITKIISRTMLKCGDMSRAGNLIQWRWKQMINKTKIANTD